MVLPVAFNQISLGQIQTEFGGVAPTATSEYYRGGLYTTANNTNVPTGGTIALSNFYSGYRGFQVQMNFLRDAGDQNFFFLDSPGLPRIEITTPVNGGGSIITYFIPTNVVYTITANVGNDRIRQALSIEYDDDGNIISSTLLNGMQLEDANDFDWNDLEWYPQQGTVYESGGSFFYILNI
jgi:hypothetical protein